MLVTPLRQKWSQRRMPFLLGEEAHDHVAHGLVVRDQGFKGGSPGNICWHRSARYSFCPDEIHDGLKQPVLTAEQANDGLSGGPDGTGHLVQGDLIYPTL